MKESQQIINLNSHCVEMLIKSARAGKRGSSLMRHQQYERFKQQLRAFNLSADEYEIAARRLADALGI